MRDIHSPPYGFERYRRLPTIMPIPFGSSWAAATGGVVPQVAADNTGAALTNPMPPPYFALNTGAAGINKGIEVVYKMQPPGATDPNDGFAKASDADGHGFWRRIITLDALIVPRSTSGTLSGTSRSGIGMGAYAVVPPNPATTNNNLIRLYWRADNNTWELLTHKGDGVATAVITNVTGVAAPVIGRCSKLRIEHNPGQYVRAYINGILGAEAASNFKLPPAANAFACMVSMFCESGSASANVRAWVGGHVMEIIDLD